MTGVLYDRKIPLRLKAKVYEANIRPAVTYGSECWAMKVTNKRKIATTEMRMLRGILGVSRRDHMRNEDIRHILNISPIDEVMRCGRLRWFGHVQRRDADNVTRRVMNLAIPGTRRRGRPKKTWPQQLKNDTTAVGVTQDMALDHAHLAHLERPFPYLVGVGLVLRPLRDREKASQGEQGEHGRPLLADCQRSNPSKVLKSSMITVYGVRSGMVSPHIIIVIIGSCHNSHHV